MDLATFIGFVVGVVFILLGIVSTELNFAQLELFWEPRSLFIVCGGVTAAVLISHPLGTVLLSWRVAIKALLHVSRRPSELIRQMVDLAMLARREGVVALEHVQLDLNNAFLTKGLMLVVDGTDSRLIEDILEDEIDTVAYRHGVGRDVFDSMARYAPAWGMIGTLIGLVLMLVEAARDPSKMGEGLATALLTTFYGAILAYFLFGPIAEKLGKRSEEELIERRMVVRGVLAIQRGDNPRLVQEKLRAFLPSEDQAESFIQGGPGP